MDEQRHSRRGFLAACAGALSVGTAGCSVAPSQTVDPETRDGGNSPTPTQSGTGTVDQTPESLADRFVETYRDTIDSVAQIRVYGRTGSAGGGTGWLYEDGHLVTNEHVVADTSDVYVRFPESGWTRGSVLGTDFYSDLAVLEVDETPDQATPLDLRRSDPAIGTEVVTIGNPFGRTGSVSAGIVSGVNRTLQRSTGFAIPDVIQTDAPVNPGNSGGPLVTLDGTVAGVINSGGGDNVGFAISASLTRRVVPALIADGNYDHTYMGIVLRSVGPLLARANNIDRGSGVYVDSVPESGPADGVLQGSTGKTRVDGHDEQIPVGGDVIVRMGDTPIPEQQALSTYLALETSPGDTVPITIIRDGAEQTVDLTLGTRPEPS